MNNLWQKLMLSGSTAALIATVPLAAAQAQSASSDQAIETVVVTGSLIVRNGYQAPTPVTVLGVDALNQAGTIDIADAVNRMPALSGSITPNAANNSVSQGSAGLNNLNLRGLGADRTLVLMDGERLVGSSANAVLGNGGAVDVNVIPDGLVQRVDVVTGGASAAYGSDAVSGVVNFVLDHNYTGIKGNIEGGMTTYGDNDSYKGELTVGTPFAGGRGHFEAFASVSGQTQVAQTARPWTSNYIGQEGVPNPAYTATNGMPQYIFEPHVGLSTGAPGGEIASGPLAQTIFVGPEATPYHAQGTVDGIFLIGGDWALTQITGTPNIAPTLNLATAFSRASYQINDNIEVWGQLQWADSLVFETAGLPSTYLGNLTIQANNPFIPASIVTAMKADGLTSLTMGLSDVGGNGIGLLYNRVFDRIDIGTDGDVNAFGTDWKWNGGFQHSVTNGIYYLNNDPVNSNLMQALATVQGPTGAPVCSNPSGGCVPYDPFGVGVNSPAANAYVTDHGANQTIKLHQSSAVIGASGNPFSIWAGPVSLAFGADWRYESANGTADANDQNTGLNYGNFHPIIGSYQVTEGFLETVIPLATNTSWAESLDLNAAMRATDYSLAGYVTTWKVGGTYQPIDDIKFRFTRSQDIRAPNLAELFSPGGYGQLTGTDPFHNNAVFTGFSLSIGNPSFKPETAETTGFGVVLTPTFIPNFAASADYFNISIGGAISSQGGQTYIQLCYQGQTQYCQFITRNAAGTITQVESTGVNIASLKENGLDIEASYNMPLSNIYSGWDGDLAFRFLGTRIFEYQSSALGIITESAGTPPGDGSGLPHFRANASATYTLDPVSTTLTARYIAGDVQSNSYVQCTSACPASTGTFPTVASDKIPSNTLFDAAFDYKYTDNLDLYFNVDNFLNTPPPIIPPGIGVGYVTGESNAGYDRLGRLFRLGVRFKM